VIDVTITIVGNSETAEKTQLMEDCITEYTNRGFAHPSVLRLADIKPVPLITGILGAKLGHQAITDCQHLFARITGNCRIRADAKA
jgi:hypothetical protein